MLQTTDRQEANSMNGRRHALSLSNRCSRSLSAVCTRPRTRQSPPPLSHSRCAAAPPFSASLALVNRKNLPLSVGFRIVLFQMCVLNVSFSSHRLPRSDERIRLLLDFHFASLLLDRRACDRRCCQNGCVHWRQL